MRGGAARGRPWRAKEPGRWDAQATGQPGKTPLKYFVAGCEAGQNRVGALVLMTRRVSGRSRRQKNVRAQGESRGCPPGRWAGQALFALAGASDRGRGLINAPPSGPHGVSNALLSGIFTQMK